MPQKLDKNNLLATKYGSTAGTTRAGPVVLIWPYEENEDMAGRWDRPFSTLATYCAVNQLRARHKRSSFVLLLTLIFRKTISNIFSARCFLKSSFGDLEKTVKDYGRSKKKQFVVSKTGPQWALATLDFLPDDEKIDTLHQIIRIIVAV